MVRIQFPLDYFMGPVIIFHSPLVLTTRLNFMFLTLKDMVGMRRSPDSTLLQQPRHSIHKPCLTLHKERECKNAPDTVEGGKTRTENRKVIVRSSYFKDKSINENDQEDKQEKHLLEDGIAIDVDKNAVPESAHFENSYFNGKVMKRKTSPGDSFEVVCVFLSLLLLCSKRLCL